MSLGKLLAESDFVAIHTNLTESSYHLMNKRTLRMMKPSAVLINCARGPCVCEADLIDALERKVSRVDKSAEIADLASDKQVYINFGEAAL